MLRSFNFRTLDLIPRLVTNRRDRSSVATYPLRRALVRHNLETTYVVPGDWPTKDGDAWFLDGALPAAGSDVQYLIDGAQTYKAMVEAMETADRPEHFIVVLGWQLQHDFKLPNGKTFFEIAEARATLKVPIRVLLWDNLEYLDSNVPARALNDLRTVKQLDVVCQIDDNTNLPVSNTLTSVLGKGNVSSLGSHHHKILLVSGREGLVGFCGGLDFDQNRLSYLHDVHVRVVGDAANELLKIAVQRWSHAKNDGVAATPATLTLSPPAAPQGAVSAPYWARVVQTVGNPELTGSTPNTLWRSVKRAVGAASRFIYLEDQYFWSLDLVKELVDASKRVKHITILLPAAQVTEWRTWNLRQKAIWKILELGGSGIERRIGIFQHQMGPHEFVHAKMFVMDDELALVGSANANNRGYFIDSEAAVGITDRDWTKVEGARQGQMHVIEANLARRLRIELWREHLGLDDEELFDGVGARAHWDVLPTDAKVAPYEAVNLKALMKPYADWARDEAVRRSVKAKLDKAGVGETSPGYSWVGGLIELVAMGLPPAAVPVPWDTKASPSQRAPWWEAPYADWDPGAMPEDLIVDPPHA